MHKSMLVLTFSLFVLCGGESLFVADQAYGCYGCCVCLAGGGYKNCPGCTPPGQQYDGTTCPWCAVDPEAIQASTPRYSGPSGMRGDRDLSVSLIRQLETDEVIRGGQCMRRKAELRFLSNVGEGLSFYGQKAQPMQLQVAEQTD